jgi:hypothetical protein
MTASMAKESPQWEQIILSDQEPAQVWRAIFAQLREIALATTNPQALHKATVAPDRLLAEAAWTIWSEFPTQAPSVVAELTQFWTQASASGTAVLILDALSLRELPLIVNAARNRGITPSRIEVRAAAVPTDTDRFAEALGLPSRSKLANSRYPSTFIFAAADTATDVLEMPFEDCVGSIPPKPRLFLWHTWPDDKLVHGQKFNPAGHTIVAKETAVQLASDGFWRLIDRVRQGRRLIITGDHGYAVSQFFSTETKDKATKESLLKVFHGGRCAREDAANPWDSPHLPPLAIRHDGWLVVLGQRKWVVSAGFPHLCHEGLTLLEAAVPVIELPAV